MKNLQRAGLMALGGKKRNRRMEKRGFGGVGGEKRA